MRRSVLVRLSRVTVASTFDHADHGKTRHDRVVPQGVV